MPSRINTFSLLKCKFLLLSRTWDKEHCKKDFGIIYKILLTVSPLGGKAPKKDKGSWV